MAGEFQEDDVRLRELLRIAGAPGGKTFSLQYCLDPVKPSA